jgi:hypothetical protein
MNSTETGQIRDQLERHLGAKVAWFLGPYPDEVGWVVSGAMYLGKLIVAGMVFWSLVDSVIPKALGDEIAERLILCGIVLTVCGWLSPND